MTLDGFQNNCLGGGRSGARHMEVRGTFMHHWTLALGTGAAFLDPDA